MKLTGTKVVALYLHSPTRLQVVLGPLRGMSTLLFAVDYVTFVHGWLRYFCSRLMKLLCSRLIALRVGVECNVVRTQKNGDRAWCVIDPVRGALRDVLTHTHTHTHKWRKKDKEGNKTDTHITYKHAHNAFVRCIGLRHFLELPAWLEMGTDGGRDG